MQVAQALNEAGFDIRKTITSYTMELDWTPESVKECMWRPAQKALLGKHSTTELNKHEDITRVYDTVNRFLAKLGIHAVSKYAARLLRHGTAQTQLSPRPRYCDRTGRSAATDPWAGESRMKDL